MKKMLAIVLALMLWGWQVSLPGAMATIEYDPCEVGDHVYEVVEVDEWGIGYPRYFTVDGCEYSSEAHEHYHFIGGTEYVYSCMYCGNTETYFKEYVAYEMGEFCTLHDFGR